jgi:DNA polymerase III subunit delta
VSNLYLISGTDEFSIRQKAGDLIEELCGSSPEENPCLEIIHGDSTDMKTHDMLNELVISINTPAFFGAAKTIWLKRFDFSQISKSKASKDAADGFVNALKSGLPEDVTIVLDGQLLDKRSALFKECKKSGEVTIFDKVDVKSRDWEQNIRIKVMRICQENGIRITPDAASFLSETSGTDTGRILSELQKLFAYITPRDQITVEDCYSICSITPEAASWAFADALAARNLGKALETLNILFSNKALGVKVLYSVIGRFQEMISIKVAAKDLSLANGAPYPRFKNAIENIHPVLKEKLQGSLILKKHPYAAWMLFSKAAKFADSKLAEALTAILKVNRDLVSGGSDPRIALELLAAKICR